MRGVVSLLAFLGLLACSSRREAAPAPAIDERARGEPEGCEPPEVTPEPRVFDPGARVHASMLRSELEMPPSVAEIRLELERKFPNGCTTVFAGPGGQCRVTVAELELATKALRVGKRVLPAGDLRLARLHNDVGFFAALAGSHKLAELSFETALQVARTRVGPRDPLYLEIAANYVTACAVKENNRFADLCQQRAKKFPEIYDWTLHDPINKEAVLGSWADQAFWGRDAGALERHHERAPPSAETASDTLAIARLRLGDEHPRLAWYVLALAHALINEQYFAAATSELERYDDLVARHFGGDAQRLAAGEYGRARLAEAQGDAEAVTRHLERAVDLSPGDCLLHLELAVALMRRAQYEDARAVLAKAAALAEPQGWERDEVEREQARLAMYTGSFAAAAAGLEAIIERATKAMSHLDDAALRATLRELAIAREAEGRTQDARALWQRLLAARSSDAEETFELDAAISHHLLAAPKDETAAALAVKAILSRKAIEFERATVGMLELRGRLSPWDRAELRAWRAARSQVAELALTRIEDRPLVGPPAIELATQALDKASATLSLRATGGQPPRPVDIGRVRAAIPEKGALLEFAVWVPLDAAATRPDARWGEPRIAAYVLRRAGAPVAVDLGPAVEIERRVYALRQAITRRDCGDPVAWAAEVHAAVLSPLGDLLHGADPLIVAPDGALNLLPFAALRDNDRWLVEATTIVHVATGRDLTRPPAPTASGRPVVVASPDFGPRERLRSDRGLFAEYERFEKLEHAAAEGEAVAELLRAELIAGDAASEERIKALERPRLLHIASHGFVVSGGGAEVDPHTRGIVRTRSQRTPAAASNDPMLRAGIALANANTYGASPSADDGILTAFEAAALDLTGTELVVLSACETGLGEVRRADGVYGLARAFSLAGASSQVLSLWRVNDAATGELMREFYRRLDAGAGRAEALRAAQVKLLDAGHAHPRLWAGFIAAGDWRPLPVSARPSTRIAQRRTIANPPADDDASTQHGNVWRNGRASSSLGPTIRHAWTARGRPVRVEPVATENVVVATAVTGTARGLVRESGAALWSIELGGRVEAVPVADAGTVVAFANAGTIWEPGYDGKEKGSGYTLTADGSTVTNGRVIAMDIATGAIRWRQERSGARIDGGVGVFDGRILFSHFDAIEAVSIADGRTLWRNEDCGRMTFAPVFLDGLLIATTACGTSRTQVIAAFDLETGLRKYVADLPEQCAWAQPSSDGEWVYAPCNDGKLHMLARKDGKIVRTIEAADARLVLGDGNAYQVVGKTLRAVDLVAGTTIWDFSLGFNGFHPDAIWADGRLVLATFSDGGSSNVELLDPAAATRQTLDVPADIQTAPVVYRQMAFFGTDQGVVALRSVGAGER